MLREAQDILRQHLKRVGLKQTEQRNTILRSFLETREHLSTEELHRLVKKKDLRIGVTTVYGTLKLLSECGLASAAEFHDGKPRFEPGCYRRSSTIWFAPDVAVQSSSFRRRSIGLEQEIGGK